MARALRLPSVLGVVGVVSAVALLVPEHAHAAGTVLPEPVGPVATGLDLEVAVASTPSGSTRWQRFSLKGARKALWLVPARPGAALDLAGGSFLDALGNATKPRVLAPAFREPTGCAVKSGVDLPAWTSFPAPEGALGEAVVLDSETTARAHIASLGYVVGTRAASRIQSAFGDGWKLVALEVQGDGATTASPTLRVSDDGPALLPLALTGGADVDMHLTAFVVGAGTASLPRMIDAVGPYGWSAAGSDYVDQIATQRDGLRFFREAAGHDLLFSDTQDQGVYLASVSTLGYVDRCASSITDASSSSLVVGRTCAAGALGRVPGGVACTPDAGQLAASRFTCGASDDLALALSGQRPRNVAVTRFSALLAGGSYALDVPLAWESTTMSPVKRAGSYTCPVTPPSSSSSGFVDTPARPPAQEEWIVTHESCTSSSTVVVEDDTPPPPDDGCGGSTTTTSEADPATSYHDSESCTGSQSSSSSSSGSDGWDSSDDSSDSSSSSSSSDGCGASSSSSSSSSSSGDGWDSKDSSSDSCSSSHSSSSSSSSSEATALRVAKSGRPLALHVPKKPARRGPSPLSRVTIVAAALILPLRRRLRARDGGQSSRADFRA